MNPLLGEYPYLEKAFEDLLITREKSRRYISWICRPLSDFHPSCWANGKIENPDPIITRKN
jgi:hypothetical protein